jgi:hypothetical protein
MTIIESDACKKCSLRLNCKHRQKCEALDLPVIACKYRVEEKNVID